MPILAVLFLLPASFLIKNSIKNKKISLGMLVYIIFLLLIGFGFIISWFLIKTSIIIPPQKGFINII